METKDGVHVILQRLDSIDAKIERIDGKLDIVKDHAARIDVTLATNTADIRHHIRRTDVLEERVEQVNNALTPVAAYVSKIKGGVALLVVVVGILEGAHWFLR